MTKAKIIDAAFKVWGREFYLNTSLSHVARELKVCKPALYRHFRNKDDLIDGMIRHFFDDFDAFVLPEYEKALATGDSTGKIFMLIRAFAEYHARNVLFFIFSMVKLHNRKLDNFDMENELRIRGIDISRFHDFVKNEYVFEPLAMRLINATLTFCMAEFHRKNRTVINPPSEAAIAQIIGETAKIMERGFGYGREEIDALDYEGLEGRIAGTVNNIEDDPLLKAVAGAVAEAGPWEASMKQVARRSGLSKSSLYGHYKNKQDMLYQLFKTEYVRINDFARQGIRQSAVSEEQLYLGIFSIVEYLRSKPDILVALDWIRNRNLNLKEGKRPSHKLEFLPLFEDIDIKLLREMPQGAPEGGELWVSPWILFLIINTLMQTNSGQIAGDVPNDDIRFLYRFLTLGIGGFKI
ncbi:MAG: TetR/AcrR family transcriptional regulator [Treponema sp.]|jgi:AcrR family transcriptional regulator|nr:TetR/AcrR family transcriptional regulator [Treponema sp.]